MCHFIWLCSRKYGTVWYHPASSKLWYLTTLSFINFQGKLTGTSCDSLHMWSQLVRLAVCLALGAHFASTLTSARIYICPWIEISHHWGTYHFSIFQKKTLEIKHHLALAHSNSIIPYHTSQQPRQRSWFLLPTSFKLKFDHASQLTQNINRILCCKQGIKEE
jgi:hypothetical protein